MSKFKKGIGLFLIYLTAGCILLELSLRIFLPFEKKRTRYFLTREVFQYKPANIHFDPELGFFNNSHLSVLFTSPEFKTRITINSQGCRDDEESLLNPSILILGDSFGFGWGVEENQTCASFLEELTNKKVLNMGVSGYGTVQEFLLLKRFVRGRDMTGKIAIFLFCPNDLRDNMAYEAEVYPNIHLEKSGLIQYQEITQAAYKSWLTKIEAAKLPDFCRYSYLAYSMMAMSKKIDRGIRERSRKGEVRLLGREEEEEEMAGIFNLVVGDIKSFSRKTGVSIVFAYIPIDYVLPGNDDNISALAGDILAKQKIPFLDLRSVLKEEDYWRYDDHWRESGHFKAALAIRDFLKENKLLE